MVTRRVIAMWLIGVALSVVAAGDEPRKVSGQVFDKAGRPVAGAEVATMWSAMGGMAMRAFHAARTDPAGRFTLEVELLARACTVADL